MEPRGPESRVRELRENKLMTQAQLARKAKVALRTIHSVEKGMNCRMDTKRKILLALGLSFEDKDQVFPPISRAGCLPQDVLEGAPQGVPLPRGRLRRGRPRGGSRVRRIRASCTAAHSCTCYDGSFRSGDRLSILPREVAHFGSSFHSRGRRRDRGRARTICRRRSRTSSTWLPNASTPTSAPSTPSIRISGS